MLSQAAKVKLLASQEGTPHSVERRPGMKRCSRLVVKRSNMPVPCQASEGRPPFLVVVDVGHSIELYSEFTRTGGNYVPFPDPRSHRFLLGQLSDTANTGNSAAWSGPIPLALDPARRSARVTREIAENLGRLGSVS